MTSHDDGRGEVSTSGPTLVIGARVEGVVARIEAEGVFVQLQGTTNRQGLGLLTNIESGLPRGIDPRKHFTVGQTLETKIVSIDKTGRYRLSVRALQADDEKALFEQHQGEARATAEPPSGFGTFGDLLSRSRDKRR